MLALCACYVLSIWIGVFDSRTGKVYIGVKQIDGPTDILCVVGVNNVVTELRLSVCPDGRNRIVICYLFRHQDN
jgi:hypothetical protein